MSDADRRSPQDQTPGQDKEIWAPLEDECTPAPPPVEELIRKFSRDGQQESRPDAPVPNEAAFRLPVPDGMFKIRYSCGDVFQLPIESSIREQVRAIYRVPCPECRQHPSIRHRYFPTPPEPGQAYQFVVEAADGAPLTAALSEWLHLCVEHDDDAQRKDVPTPPGVVRRVDFILGRGYCDICDGTVSIAPVATECNPLSNHP